MGIAMWMPPRPVELKETWGEWFEGWRLWGSQVVMNLWYGRGGLNVKVSESVSEVVRLRTFVFIVLWYNFSRECLCVFVLFVLLFSISILLPGS